MPAYHCEQSAEGAPEACGCALLPLRAGGGAAAAGGGPGDVVDEALGHLRANLLFRSFDVQGPADRTLLYVTFYLSLCMNRLADVPTKPAALAEVATLAGEPFKLPGEPGFALGGFMPAHRDAAEADAWREYFRGMREVVGLRLLEMMYRPDGSVDKFWAPFCRRKFMDKVLN